MAFNFDKGHKFCFRRDLDGKKTLKGIKNEGKNKSVMVKNSRTKVKKLFVDEREKKKW